MIPIARVWDAREWLIGDADNYVSLGSLTDIAQSDAMDLTDWCGCLIEVEQVADGTNQGDLIKVELLDNDSVFFTGDSVGDGAVSHFVIDYHPSAAVRLTLDNAANDAMLVRCSARRWNYSA
jgi:hypothetical protein